MAPYMCLLLGRIARTNRKDAASCYTCSVVCVCVLTATKTTELIEMTYGLWTRVSPRNYIYIYIYIRGRGNLGFIPIEMHWTV